MITGQHELRSVELELKKGMRSETSACCASGTVDFVYDADAHGIHDQIDALDLEALILSESLSA